LKGPHEPALAESFLLLWRQIDTDAAELFAKPIHTCKILPQPIKESLLAAVNRALRPAIPSIQVGLRGPQFPQRDRSILVRIRHVHPRRLSRSG
jgi:hypothetical protein